MESEERETTGVTRSQNVIHVAPHDRAAIAPFLAPPLERIEEADASTQLLIITPDAETAIAISAASIALVGERQADVIPVTNLGRAARLFRSRHARAVAATPETVLSLLQGSSLKLDQLRTVILAWIDDAPDAGYAAALEAVMGEVPKTAARILVVSRLTPEVEAIAERYVRRARRVLEPAEAEARATPIHYVTVSASSRAEALRRLLDTLDPLKASVFVRSDDSAQQVRHTLRALGYGPGDDSIEVTRGAARPDSTLIVLHDLPATRSELRTLIGDSLSGKQVVALARPRQLTLVRDLAAGGGITPMALPGAVGDARSREESMRNELRAALANGAPARELLALEPLLSEYDGIEIAAAALYLLDRTRETAAAARGAHREAAQGRAGAGAGAVASGWTNLFITVGSRDGLQPGDIVGAILNESGIAREHVGKVDIREGFSLVQVASADVQTVVNAVNGKMIKGRPAVVRTERDPGAERGERPERGTRPRSGGPGGRPDRGAPRGPPRDRGDRGDRPPRDDRPRSGAPPRDRGDRPPVRNSYPKRGPDRGGSTGRDRA